MRELFKRKFALTDQGAVDLIKSSTSVFLALCMNMAPAILLMLFFERTINGRGVGNTVFYTAAALILLLMYLLLSVEYTFLFNATFRESENLRIDLARRLSRLPLSYFSRHELTDLAQSIVGDVAAMEHALSHAIPKFIGFIGFFALISAMLLAGKPVLGLCVILPICLYFGALFLSRGMQVRGNRRYYKKLRDNAERFQEAIELQQEIKSFGMEADVAASLNREVELGEQIHIRAEFGGATVAALSGLLLQLSYILVIVLGAELLLTGDISLLYLIGYLLAAMRLRDAAEGTGQTLMEIFYIAPMAERIREIRESPVQDGESAPLSRYDICLEHVSFAYGPETPVLSDVSFTAKQGEVTALVGRSGCGKTSILRLVSRLYDYDGGSIRISGRELKEISTESLFEKLSVVFQDVTLFNASVMENIRLGDINASDEQVREAARLANCEEFIERLPQGYESLIGENGVSLSGGERQRLSIARAFLKNAPIIILDEISASLDVDNEQKIQESLNRLIEGKTVLIISHRLKSVEHADKIVVIDEGRVECEGTHESLLADSKLYRELVEKTRMAEQFVY